MAYNTAALSTPPDGSYDVKIAWTNFTGPAIAFAAKVSKCLNNELFSTWWSWQHAWPGDSLRVNNKTFRPQRAGTDQQRLIDEDGQVYLPGSHHQLIQPSDNESSALRPASSIERRVDHASTRTGYVVVDEEDVSQVLVRRLTERLNSRARAASRGRTVEQIFRWLVRQAMTVLRRMFGISRHRPEEQPDAVTHQHTVDQYRSRAPGSARKIWSPTIFRELVAA